MNNGWTSEIARLNSMVEQVTAERDAAREAAKMAWSALHAKRIAGLFDKWDELNLQEPYERLGEVVTGEPWDGEEFYNTNRLKADLADARRRLEAVNVELFKRWCAEQAIKAAGKEEDHGTGEAQG